MLAFIEEHNYPCPWTLETLQTYCISFRVEEGSPPDTVAYLWTIWDAPGVLDIHACSKRRLWLTRELVDRLYTIAELFGAHTLTSTPQGERAPLMRRLLFNMGFEREGSAMTKRLDPPDGIYVPQDTRAACAAPSAPADHPSDRNGSCGG